MVTPKVQGERSYQSDSYHTAVDAERATSYETSTAAERRAAHAHNVEHANDVPSPSCTSCGQHRFPVPTLCWWCRRDPGRAVAVSVTLG
jgi:uncharacterized OB-fold protein